MHQFHPDLPEEDTRSMVRILGETATLSGDHHEKKHFLMAELCQLVNADSWAWTFDSAQRPGPGGSATEIRSDLHGLPPSQPPPHIPCEQPALLPLPATSEFLKNEEIGPVILNSLPLGPSYASTLIVYRGRHRTAFTRGQCRIVNIILDEVPWLHMTDWPEEPAQEPAKLSPRQQVVLNLLLDGMDRKHIAARLSISEHTVSGYAKNVYSHFNVHSQAQLMRKFLSGNYRPTPR